jgi:hypothetical protein
MKAILILAGPYSTCKSTQIIWKKLCDDNDIDLSIFDLTNKDGQEISAKLNIKSFPAFIVDNNVVAVGHPDEQSATNVIQKLNK